MFEVLFVLLICAVALFLVELHTVKNRHNTFVTSKNVLVNYLSRELRHANRELYKNRREV